jgi:lactobin A/cerein 7B family class IIb bacteriocin
MLAGTSELSDEDLEKVAGGGALTSAAVVVGVVLAVAAL